jgi:hypothetical protein
MFVKHLFYREGSRIGTVFPYCEKANADAGSSDGQTSSHLTTEHLGEVSCPYCHWEKLKDIYTLSPGLPESNLGMVHYSVHPVFSRDALGRLLHWEAQCGIVSLYPELCLATRNRDDISCLFCVTFDLL